MGNQNDMGIVLAEIKAINYYTSHNSGYLKIELNVSNFKTKENKIIVSVFDNGYHLSSENFLNFLGTKEESKAIGKLFYCNIEKNNNGYDTITQLYFQVKEDQIFFDPRKRKIYTRKIENSTTLTGIMD